MPAELKIAQDELTAKLGTPVLIRREGDSGKITINFYSQEEFQNIILKLGLADEGTKQSGGHPEQF